jgi:excisionase family DNA binding protein
MKYLTVKAGHELKAIEAILDSKLRAVKDAQGNVTFTEEGRDSGSQVMTIGDVAALLQLPVSAIREMTKARAQRGVHPLPFTKINGKAIRFDRVKVMRWLETMPERRRPRQKR